MFLADSKESPTPPESPSFEFFWRSGASGPSIAHEYSLSWPTRRPYLTRFGVLDPESPKKVTLFPHKKVIWGLPLVTRPSINCWAEVYRKKVVGATQGRSNSWKFVSGTILTDFLLWFLRKSYLAKCLRILQIFFISPLKLVDHTTLGTQLLCLLPLYAS